MMSGDFLLIQHDGPIIMKLHCGHYLVLSFVVAYSGTVGTSCDRFESTQLAIILSSKATIYRILVSCPRRYPQVLRVGGYYNYSITASLFISRVLSSSFTIHSPLRCTGFPKKTCM